MGPPPQSGYGKVGASALQPPLAVLPTPIPLLRRERWTGTGHFVKFPPLPANHNRDIKCKYNHIHSHVKLSERDNNLNYSQQTFEMPGVKNEGIPSV